MNDTDLSRRAALARLAGLAAGGVALSACPAPDDSAAPADDDDANDDDATGDDDDSATPDCVLTPEQTAGPFYFDAGQVRSDITEGLPGAPLAVRITVVDAATCSPIRDAIVDLWHADAAGRYSGYPGQGDDTDEDTSGEDFLRGVQVTDADGRVAFTTLFPGWYPGRTAHVHVKVHLDANTLVTSQFYFPQTTNDAVYAEEPYASRTTSPITNDQDSIFRRDDPAAILSRTVPDGAGWTCSMVLGVAT
jgi:protocatechuate 3,4-dioxygenase beta subunit